MERFQVDVSDAHIADLRERLTCTRWPDALPGAEWELGTDASFLRDLCERWAHAFDWNEFVARCNRHPQVRTTVDGVTVHAIIAACDRDDGVPLLLLHGWPGSTVEYHDVVEALRRDHHVVVASLPGYGFSGPTMRRGIDQLPVARVLVELMRRMGHERFVVGGSDWGATIGSWMAAYEPQSVIGLPHDHGPDPAAHPRS